MLELSFNLPIQIILNKKKDLMQWFQLKYIQQLFANK